MELLEYLDAAIRPMFLSDLRLPRYWPAILHRMEEIEDQRFSPEEWAEAVSYLSGAPAPLRFADAQGAKAYFQERLGEAGADTGPPGTGQARPKRGRRGRPPKEQEISRQRRGGDGKD